MNSSATATFIVLGLVFGLGLTIGLVYSHRSKIEVPMNQAEEVLTKLKKSAGSDYSSITFYADGRVTISADIKGGGSTSSRGDSLTEAVEKFKKSSKLLD